jgi:predicted permease
MWSRFRSWLSALLHRGRLERDLADELAFHLDSRAAYWRAHGLAPADATRRARLEFGALGKHTEACRESRGLRLADELGADVRYALRQLRRNPTFAIVAIGTLAIAVGANTAIFSLVDAVLIKTLPIHSPQELRQLSWIAPNDGTSVWGSVWYNGSTRETGDGRLVATSFSYPACDALRRGSTSFRSVICSSYAEEVNIGLGGRATLGRGQLVSGNFFSGLGVRPHAGRVIVSLDDREGQSPVAVLGYAFWRRELGGDPDAIGRPIAVNGLAATIVGVAPPAFLGISPGVPTDIFLPLVPAHTVVYDIPGVLHSPRHWGFLLLARLAPAVGDERARQETGQLLARELAVRPPEAAVRTMPRVELTPAGRGLDSLREQFTKPLQILMLVVGAVLLIACANIAGLLSTRMSARQREIATRVAIGAGRGRVARQVLTEGAVLALAGGLVGLLLALAIRRLLPALLSEGPDTLVLDMSMDTWMVAFAAALCATAGLLCGVIPALRAPRIGLAPIIARGASTTTASRLGAIKALVIVQVAVTVVLLVGAGLFVKTLTNLRSEQLGFEPDHLLLFEMNATLNGYKDQRLYDFYQAILARVATLPGVVGASLSRWGLVSGTHTGDGITVPGQHTPIHVEVHFVLPGYFRTMGIPLLEGRDVTSNDREGSAPVVLVNRALAARAYGTGSPLGRLLTLGETTSAVIGVVGDARFSELRDAPAPTLYVPFRQHDQHVATFALRTAGDPAHLMPSVEKVVNELAPDVPVANVRTQDEQIDRAVRQERLFANLVSGFAVLAALLACLGIYGTLAYAVARRTREIGVRMALGADRAAVMWLILRESIAPVLAGVGLGILASWWATQLVTSMLFGLTPHDPATYAAAAAVLVASALVAGWLPSRRAAHLDPMMVLRCE